MTPERFGRLQEIWSAVLGWPPHQRSAAINRMCSGDSEMQREVESLLEAHQHGRSFMETPAAAVVHSEARPAVSALASASRVGRYEIVAFIAAGGMGEVYKARDTHLDRVVALKVLQPHKVGKGEPRRRFVQEAKAASALNHPNIVTVHDIDQQDGVDYIVMEYVAGKPLDELIPRTGMPLNEAVRMAVQIADAMAAAHEAGIVHRDLKPGNVMVSEKGQVKVVDFGLAKLIEAVPRPEEEAVIKSLTDENTILGSLHYMSPEQAQGMKVEARSDIFSFGSVLYEMVTGRRAFEGGSKMSVLAGIIHNEPGPIGAEAPQQLYRIISRCLRKDPAHRFQTMADLKVALENLTEEPRSGQRRVAHHTPQKPGEKVTEELKEESKSINPAETAVVVQNFHLPRALVGVLALVAAGIAVAYWFRPGGEPFLIPAPPPLEAIPLTTDPGWEADPSLSPDGDWVVFSWDGEKRDNTDIYKQIIGRPSTRRRLTDDAAPDLAAAWSPDGASIAFLRESPSTLDVMLDSPQGGASRKLASVRGYSNIAWTLDSRWLIVSDQPSANERSALFLISKETGEKRRLTTPPVGNFPGDYDPAVSPDGLTIAFRRDTKVLVMPLKLLPEAPVPAGEPGAVFSGEPLDVNEIAWTPNGRELIMAGRTPSLEHTLWRVPVDRSRSPYRITDRGAAGQSLAISRTNGSGTARLVYSRELHHTDVWHLSLGKIREKAPTPRKWITSTKNDTNAQYSPDGKKIAFASDRSGKFEVWVCDADRANAFQLTSIGAHSATPRWSPDGGWIAFDSNKEGNWDVYVTNAVPGGEVSRITSDPGTDAIPSWSRDGRWIYFTSQRTNEYQIWRVPATGGKAIQITKTGGHVAFESFDGTLLYYTKDVKAHTSLWSISLDGGIEREVLKSVSWRGFAPTRDGIWFLAWDGNMAGIKFHSFAGGPDRTVASVERYGNGLSVSPDSRSVLYTQREFIGSDLMLVQNFR